MKIAFDIGGVLSKYPALIALLNVCDAHPHCEVHVISDMHPVEQTRKMLAMNWIRLPDGRVHSADFAKHGEKCKAVLCEELGIDILVDDFAGYVGKPGSPPCRLLVMPDVDEPYYHDRWKTDGSEGGFGRRK